MYLPRNQSRDCAVQIGSNLPDELTVHQRSGLATVLADLCDLQRAKPDQRGLFRDLEDVCDLCGESIGDGREHPWAGRPATFACPCRL